MNTNFLNNLVKNQLLVNLVRAGKDLLGCTSNHSLESFLVHVFINISYYLSWVQALCFSLSPPEVTISLPPGLISLNSTHLSLITLPAVLHHHGLFIHLTPTTLPVWIVYVYVFPLVSHAGDTCTVCRFLSPSRLPVFFCLPCWSFCFFIIKEFFLHLDPHPVLPLSLISPFRDRIPTARMGPTGKLLNVHQGDRGIEDYVRDFLVVARQ